jgi:hypothetical protein
MAINLVCLKNIRSSLVILTAVNVPQFWTKPISHRRVSINGEKHLLKLLLSLYLYHLFVTSIGLTPDGSSTAHIWLTPGGSSTAHIWFTPGGSSTVHIYTQTVH